MNVLEKILEEIESLKTNLAKNNGTPQCYWHDVGLVKAKAVVKKHMGEAENDGWIPVEERLPERFTVVLASFDNGDVETLWQCWREDKEELKYFELGDEGRDGGIKNVIAWRPLPEPYKLHEHGNHTSATEEREKFFAEGEPIYERT